MQNSSNDGTGRSDRIFQVWSDSSASLDLSRLTLTGGHSVAGTSGNGGAILVEDGASVNLSEVVLVGNTASHVGGAIWVNRSGSLTVRDSVLTGNTANHAGAIYLDPSTSLTVGGSVFANNTASVSLFKNIQANNVSVTNEGNNLTDNNHGASNSAAVFSASSGDTIVDHVAANDVDTLNQAEDVQGGQKVGMRILSNISGTPLTYQWQQIQGTPINLAGDNSDTASFSVPFLPADETLTFEVTVTAGTAAVTEFISVPVAQTDVVVSTHLDGNDGYYEPGYLSLREALALAKTNPVPSTIVFDPSLTDIPLALTENQLVIDSDVEILGLGQDALTIDAQGNSRVFYVTSDTEVSIQDLTITGGSNSYGGGIYNWGDLTLDSVAVANNTATRYGGGIYNRGDLTLNSVAVSNNTTTWYGGGIYSVGNSTLALFDSMVEQNQAIDASWGRGAGVYFYGDDLQVKRSSILNNEAGNSGGGLTARYADSVTIDSSTIAANQASLDGGLHLARVADIDISNSTISGNIGTQNRGGIYYDATASTAGSHVFRNLTITDNDSNSQPGAGIYLATNSQTLELYNSIVADNVGTSGGLATDIRGAFHPDSSHNLIGVSGADTGIVNDDNNNQVGTSSNPLDPGLLPLGEYGGPTQTHALQPDSLAINTGSSTEMLDQRGFPRNVGGVDIGAVELWEGEPPAEPPANLIVSSIVDTFDGNYAHGELTLREAVAIANFRPGSDTITFDASVFTGGSASRIYLTQGEVRITETLTIDASTGTGVVISGDASGNDSLVSGTLITDVTASLAADVLDDNTRVFNFSSPTGDLTLENLTITGGRTTDFSEDGGGIRFGSNGALTVTDSLISGNSTIDYLDYGYQAHGGGIATNSGSITLIGSTVSGNHTTGFGAHGGGIYNDSGLVALMDSIVSDNSTAGEDAYGGGLYTYSGTMNLTGSTVSDNRTSGSDEADGGGIFNDSGVTSLTSSTISGNRSSGDGGGIGTRYGSVTLTSSTVSDNSTTGAGHGGGIYTATGHASYSTSGRVSLTNSTVSGNRSGGHGGGIASGGDPIWQESIYNSHALKLTNSTVSDNEAAGEGGGVYVFNHSKNSYLTLENSIVAGNLDNKSPENSGTPSDLLPDPDSTLTSNYSLIGVASGLTLAGSGNLTGTTTVPLDAGLAELGDYGGPTQTHAILPDSPAIDRASNAVAIAAGITTDQRGLLRSYDDGDDGPAGALTDMGAYELVTQLVVDSSADLIDGDYSSGELTLREALAISAAAPGEETITFSPDLTGTLLLGDADGNGLIEAGEMPTELVVAGDVVIQGLGAGDLSLSGNDASRVFRVESGITATLTGLTITGGQATDGGGIYNDGATLHLTDVTISDNHATQSGGGIYNDDGNLSLTNVTIGGNTAEKGNTAGYRGGGIYQLAGTLLVDNTDVLHNVSTSNAGGGIYIEAGTVDVNNNSLLAYNESAQGGGGIYSGGSFFSISDSEISDNQSSTTGGGVRILFKDGDTLAITNTTIAHNDAPVTGTGAIGSGGGISISRQGAGTAPVSLHITGGEIYANTAIKHGGGIYSEDVDLVLDSVTVGGTSPNTANQSGGGVYNYHGSLSIENSEISYNEALANGGGGIYSLNGPLSIVNSEVTENTGTYAGGIYVNTNNEDHTLEITGSVIANNEAILNSGAGIYATKPAEAGNILLTISDTEIRGNRAATVGGGIVFTQSSGAIGGIDATLTNTIIADNHAGGTSSSHHGGGIYSNDGDLTLNHATMDGNTAYKATGGAIYKNKGFLSISESELKNNTAQHGGGIYSSEGDLEVTHSEASDNEALSGGGGIYSLNGRLSVIDSEVSRNTAEYAGGICVNTNDADDTLELTFR